MKCDEIRVDMRNISPEDREKNKKNTELLFRLNHTMPMTEEYDSILRELLGDNLGDGSYIMAPITNIVCPEKLKLGKKVYINPGFLAMSRGGITIGDNTQIAANVQILSNNHDVYDLSVLTCKPVEIGKNVWIGAGTTILPGVRIGDNAVIGAASVVTKDVPNRAVAVCNPARVIKMLDLV